MRPENEVIQKFHLMAVCSFLGPHSTLSPATALANGRDKEQRPSAEILSVQTT